MCGKTLIKSLSVQFYLGDITRVKCRCGLCCLWDRGAHSCFADSKQLRKAFKGWRWVDGSGRQPLGSVRPRRVWGSGLAAAAAGPRRGGGRAGPGGGGWGVQRGSRGFRPGVGGVPAGGPGGARALRSPWRCPRALPPEPTGQAASVGRASGVPGGQAGRPPPWTKLDWRRRAWLEPELPDFPESKNGSRERGGFSVLPKAPR